jgi:hypothetical protein
MKIYAGTSEVAAWCGVTLPAVSNWLTRYTTYPEPDVQLGIDRESGAEHYGWEPSRRAEWLAWQHSDRSKRIERTELTT